MSTAVNNDGTYSVTVSNFTDSFTVTATAQANLNTVTYTLTPDGALQREEGALTATSGQDYTGKIGALTGYSIPETISITVGGTAINAGEDYTYNNETGDILIEGEVITGNIVITANAIANRYQVTFNLNDSRNGNNGTTSVGDSITVGEQELTVTNGSVVLYATYNATCGTLYTERENGVNIDFTVFVNAITRAGYTFGGFYQEELGVGAAVTDAHAITAETTFATANDTTEVFGYWTANTNTAYTVNHYQMGLDGEYGASMEQRMRQMI